MTIGCYFCGRLDRKGAYVSCHGDGPEPEAAGPRISHHLHGFLLCRRCKRFIDGNDPDGLRRITAMLPSDYRLRRFAASTGIFGPLAPYVTSVTPGAHRVYVEVMPWHYTFSFRVSDWPDGARPIDVRQDLDGQRCTVTFEGGSTAEYRLNVEWRRWLRDHPGELEVIAESASLLSDHPPNEPERTFREVRSLRNAWQFDRDVELSDDSTWHAD